MIFAGLSLAALARALDNKECTSVSVTRECLERIDGMKALNNFITVTADEALKAAKIADCRRSRGEKVSPLCGVPIAIKDNINVCGVKTTCASASLLDNIAESDAKVVEKLKAAGAVILGKTNMDELAMGSTNESSYFGAVKNALDKSRVPGGSSGGSANCVAAGQAFGALGTDTGGSIRQPAAFCGVVGLKPTFGSIGNTGLMGLAPSLDQIGVFARFCDDAWILFGALCNDDNMYRNKRELGGEVCGVTLGVPRNIENTVGLSEGVKREFSNAVLGLKARGARIVEVELPDFNTALAAYHIISSAEASRTLIGESSLLKNAGAEVRRRAVVGAAVTDGDNYERSYIKAAKLRRVICNMYSDALSKCDAVLTPSALTVATELGALSDPQMTHASDIFAAAASLAGLPAVSVPCGFSDGLPVGMQIIGNYYREYEILNIGRQLTIGY